MRASAFLQERQDLENMHFTIARTMMKYEDMNLGSLYDRAQHVVQAARVIKDRVYERRLYRNLLSKAANRAIESGARVSEIRQLEFKYIAEAAKPCRAAAPRASFEVPDDSQGLD